MKKDTRARVWLRRIGLLAVAAYLTIGGLASYRAWFQVKSLDLKLEGLTGVFRPYDRSAPSVATISNTSIVETTVVSYARTPVTVQLELIQGTHAETLAVQHVPDNSWAFFDPRTRQASQRVAISQEVLNRFETGRAMVRATAIGREQWTRLPPPVVRELAIEIRRD